MDLTALMQHLNPHLPFWCVTDADGTVEACSPAWADHAPDSVGAAVDTILERESASSPCQERQLEADGPRPCWLVGPGRVLPLLCSRHVVGEGSLYVGRVDMSRESGLDTLTWTDVSCLAGDLDLLLLRDEARLALDEPERARVLLRRENDLLRRALERLQKESNARKRSEDALRNRGEFLAHLSHELRNPVTGILGFLDILAPELDDQWSSLTHDLRSATHHVLDLLNDVLTMEKMNAGNLEPDLGEVDLRPIALEALRLFGVTAADKGLELVADLPRDLPPVVADARLLKQVLVNLVGNSVKFTDTGMVRVHAFVDRASEVPSVMIDVEDTGVGMSEDQVDRAFEAYRQATEDTWKSKGGTGLGLTISRRLMSIMRGGLELESEPGTGTRCRVRVPVDGRLATGMHHQPLKGSRVLVSYPHPYQVLALRRALTALGAEVLTTGDPATARAEIARSGHGFDLCFRPARGDAAATATTTVAMHHVGRMADDQPDVETFELPFDPDSLEALVARPDLAGLHRPALETARCS